VPAGKLPRRHQATYHHPHDINYRCRKSSWAAGPLAQIFLRVSWRFQAQAEKESKRKLNDSSAATAAGKESLTHVGKMLRPRMIFNL
jgi:hypothetical protein